mgnify:CR=1 FL=1
MSDIDRILLEMEKRGHAYFDETMRIGRVMDLLNRSRVQQGFEQQVVADAPLQIERKVGELVDWLVEADLRQWQRVTAHLADRRRQHHDRIVGDENSRQFHDDRSRLIDSVGREAQRVVDSYDRRTEARELADGARNAVAAAAAVGAGALGLGAMVTIAATTAAADVTGLIMASVVAAIGFFILPAKRARAKEEMRRKIADVRGRLSAALRAVRERDRPERRTHPGEHWSLQPVCSRRRRQAARHGAGAARDQPDARRPAFAHRAPGRLGLVVLARAECK